MKNDGSRNVRYPSLGSAATAGCPPCVTPLTGAKDYDRKY